MFETRSRDGKMLWIVSYSYQNHSYHGHCYLNGLNYSGFEKFHTLNYSIDRIKSAVKLYDANHPTNRRYHRLESGDIYDNVTETIINHTSLASLLNGLESNDKEVIKEAMENLKG